METNEFDSTLGGTEHLPQEANSLKFTVSRSIEIAAMTESILRPSKTKLIFQTLPVHMRRRVMSHNTKRLPRKFREGHLEQLKKSGLPPKQKRPSRKYRRRPANLLDEYDRRQKRNVWLETHIWHAKRFHMIERWGHKIAYAPCDKAFRACYRATSAHCLLQDISYLMPIQITGPMNVIEQKFTLITSKECGLSICSKAYMVGNREGSVHLFKPNQYPFGYVGKISYIWVPENDSRKTLWLFVHPAYSKELQNILKNLFQTQPHDDSDHEYTVPEKKTKCYESGDNVEVIFLPNTFNRFRLTGPNSHAILTRSLICIEDIEQIKTNEWVTQHISNNKTNLQLEEKYQYWENLKGINSPAQLPPTIVLGLIVRDPRLSRPARRTKAVTSNSTEIISESIITIPPYTAYSPLWNLRIHEDIKEKMASNAKFIERITKTQLIPGEVNMNDPFLQSVPVVLIQRPGSQDPKFKKIGYGCGWDIIVPSKYGMPFWQTFVMFGARAGGLRECESVSLEAGECYLPPDSSSGQQDENRFEIALRERYFKLPPSKRVNYVKLAINSPFLCPWVILLNDWCSSGEIDDFYVLRNKQLLMQMRECVAKKRPLSNLKSADSCLVPVYLKMLQKGNMKHHAIICLPKLDDFTQEVLGEPQHDDPNAKLRKELRNEHKSKLKSVRRQRTKLKKRGDKPTELRVKKNEPSEYVKKMRDLWLPSNVQHVGNSCSREILGYIPQAAYSFSEARCCGVGYVPFNALNTLLQSGLNKVLIRNTTSRTYRFATFQIIS